MLQGHDNEIKRLLKRCYLCGVLIRQPDPNNMWEHAYIVHGVNLENVVLYT